MENVTVRLPLPVAGSDGLAFSLNGGHCKPLQRATEQSLQVGSTVVLIDGYQNEGETFINFFRVEPDGILEMLCEEQTADSLVDVLATVN